VIERQTYETEKRVEQLKSSATAFTQHLRTLERINPKTWNNGDLNRELSKALSAVDDARGEYSKSITKINADSETEGLEPMGTTTDFAEYPTEDGGFVTWFKRGLAFTLPLILFGLIALAILFLAHAALAR
jgi:hypothetical protein